MGPPLFWITFSTLFGIDLIRFWQISSPSIEFHSDMKFTIKSSLLVNCFLERLYFIMLHKFSMGLKSGDWGGHVITLTCFSSKYSFINFDLWQGALSCIKMSLVGSICTLSAEVSRQDSKILLYCSLLRVFSIGFKKPVPWKEKHPQNIILNGCLTVLTAKFKELSKLLLRILDRLSFEFSSTFVSSEKRTFSKKNQVSHF